MNKKLLELIIDNNNNGIVIIKENIIDYMNRKAQIIFEHIQNKDIVNLLSNKTFEYNNCYYTLNILYNDQLITIYEVLDITASINLEHKKCFFDLILQKVSHGIIITDDEGRFIDYNTASEEFEGFDKKDVLGMKSNEIYDVRAEDSQILNVISSGKAIINFNGKFHTKKGKEVSLVSSYYPVYNNSKLIGTCSISENVTKIQSLLEKTMELQSTIKKNKLPCSSKYHFDDIIGESKEIKKAIQEGQHAAKFDSPVLIIGTTGTGKELFVQSIHNESNRFNKPFIPINCAAIPENLLESLLFGTTKGAFTGAENKPGLIEQAENGTLYLDELNSMPISIQAKLLRVIQENEVRRVGGKTVIDVNCRFIASINESPDYCIENNKLRDDLFYRLAVLTIEIPNLSSRENDIEILTDYYIQKFNYKYRCNVKGISSELNEIFNNYYWPGNVRELQSILEGAMSMDQDIKEIRFEHLPTYLSNKFSKFKVLSTTKYNMGSMTLNSILKSTEKEVVQKCIEKFDGNITKSAQQLGISRQNLHYRIRKLNL